MDMKFQSKRFDVLFDIIHDIQCELLLEPSHIQYHSLLNVIKKHRILPVNVGTLSKHKGTHINCNSCSNKIKRNVLKRELPCGHVYHKRCIDNWLMDNNLKCMVCGNISVLKKNNESNHNGELEQNKTQNP